MKKLIITLAAIAIIGLSYLSITFLDFPSLSSSSDDYFLTELKNFPWVKYGFRQNSEKELSYYNQITYLYSLDKRFGPNFLNTNWIREYITPEEAIALNTLVDLAGVDTEIALSVSQTSWFQNRISSIELTIMGDILTLTRRDVEVARNISRAPWFLLTQETKVMGGVQAMKDIPLDLARVISGSRWFVYDQTLSDLNTIYEFDYLYSVDTNLALTLVAEYRARDYPALKNFTTFYRENKEMVDRYLQVNSINRTSMLALSDISRIAIHDQELSESFIGEITPDRFQIIGSLAEIYTADPVMGAFASETFQNNRIALRYIQKLMEVDYSPFDHETIERVGLFIITNPEFVYEDRIEPYRYHLLTHIIHDLPLDTAQNYKNLLFVTCSIYGNRFYLWQNTDYGTLEGWSSDRTLDELEKDAIIHLIRFLIEKNEHGDLVTDLRIECQDYLYGVLDIPFTHLVNYDGTTVETSQKERGTSYVFASIYNINTLENRFDILQGELSEKQSLSYSNPLVELITKEGKERDTIFLQLCQKNWKLGACLDQTLHTRMDCIVLGISSTSMQWTAPESAHIYPAYLPSTLITTRVQEDPHAYGNPFIYKGFMAPYDEAGFKNSLDRSIETVEIYDTQADKVIGLFNKTEDRFIFDEKVIALVIIGIVILSVILADAFRIIK
ncbi:MAG: hypothetical protein HXS53_10750 [Theionarchaea archaeon]|nr:hypothetical protein [Theionarchaea archaeon]